MLITIHWNWHVNRKKKSGTCEAQTARTLPRANEEPASGGAEKTDNAGAMLISCCRCWLWPLPSICFHQMSWWRLYVATIKPPLSAAMLEYAEEVGKFMTSRFSVASFVAVLCSFVPAATRTVRAAFIVITAIRRHSRRQKVQNRGSSRSSASLYVTERPAAHTWRMDTCNSVTWMPYFNGLPHVMKDKIAALVVLTHGCFRSESPLVYLQSGHNVTCTPVGAEARRGDNVDTSQI